MAVKQAGAISARHFEELTDAAAAFHYLQPTYDNRVGIAGGAGGSSVLAADLCEEAGLNVIPFPQKIREELKARGSQIWDWISNPVDMSIRVDRNEGPGEVMKLMADSPEFDLLISFIHAHRHGPQDASVKSMLDQYCLDELDKKPLIAVIEDQEDPENIVGEFVSELNKANIPVYRSIERAALAAKKVIDYYRNKKS
jgi:acyl-CoA synthetase (NDP forming)